MHNEDKFTETRFFLWSLIALFYIFIIAFFLCLPRFQQLVFDDNTLHIYAFSEMISSQTIQEFEKLYGIKVSIKNFESNEELLAKFKITRGEGYDLITPTDYTVNLLLKEGLLHKLDHEKLPVLSEIDTRLLNNYYDSANEYSLPLAWTVYGIVFKKERLNIPSEQVSLELLFKNPVFFSHDRTMPYKISMLDDFIDAICFASLYLYQDVAQWSDDRLAKITSMLAQQKQWVEAYLYQDIRQFLFSDVFHVALTSSMNMRRILQVTDEFDFKIPEEGSLLIIENLAISARSKKIEMAHKFINFVLSRKVAGFNGMLYGYNPTNENAYADMEERFLEDPNIFPDDKIFAKLHLTPHDFPMQKFEEVWLAVKSV